MAFMLDNSLYLFSKSRFKSFSVDDEPLAFTCNTGELNEYQ